MSDELYVGYQKRAPAGIARFVRRVAVLLVLVAGVLGATLAALQRPFDRGTFEWGVAREVQGTVGEAPYPHLRLAEAPPVEGTGSPYLLVGAGKHGAGDAVAGLEGSPARVRGSLIHRGGLAMVETGPEEVEPGAAAAPEPVGTGAWEELGVHTLRGEIVDGKCYLGVMKPGRGRVHRACAVRCLSGGVPAFLAVETTTGERPLVLLVDAELQPAPAAVRRLAGLPVEARGRLLRRDGLLYFAVAAGDLRPRREGEG